MYDVNYMNVFMNVNFVFIFIFSYLYILLLLDLIVVLNFVIISVNGMKNSMVVIR